MERVDNIEIGRTHNSNFHQERTRRLTVIAISMSGNGNGRSNESNKREGDEKLAKDTLRASRSIGVDGGSGLEI